MKKCTAILVKMRIRSVKSVNVKKVKERKTEWLETLNVRV